MDKVTWSEIAVRLLFAFILGSGVAIEAKWYRTKKLLQSTAQMAIGAAMFAILIHFTTDTIVASELILAVSIVCAGVLFQKQNEPENINIVIKLWCAGAAGSLVGYGLFVPAYLGILAIVLASWIFKFEELEFIPNIELDLNAQAHFDSQTSFQNGNVEDIDESVFINPQEIHYQCQVICPAAEEIKVLGLLIELGKEKKLIPSSLSSNNIVDKSGLSEVQIEINFVTQDHDNSPLQLQQILNSLKSEVAVSTASWVCLSSGLTKNLEQTTSKPKIIDPSYQNHRQVVAKN